MPDTIDLSQLRDLLMSAEDSFATRIIAILLSAALLITVLFLVRRRTLREEYTPIWFAVAVCITLISLRLDLLRVMTRALGAWTPSSTVFFLGEVFLMMICLNYAVRLSRYGVQIKNLAQETASLRARLDELQGKGPKQAPGSGS